MINLFQCPVVESGSDICKLKIKPNLRTSLPSPEIKCDCGKCCRKPDPYDCQSFYECDEVRC